MGYYIHQTNEDLLIFKSIHENHSVPHFNAKIFIKEYKQFNEIGKIEEVFGGVNDVVCTMYPFAILLYFVVY